MSDRPYNLLFLCTGNSARSLIAESILNAEGASRFRAYSAGPQPRDAPHPVALDVLRDVGFPVNSLRSKSWDEFATEHAPPIDFVVTLCDRVVGEDLPEWPHDPVLARWHIEDPEDGYGDQGREAFQEVLRHLDRRIGLLLSFPDDALDNLALDRIGSQAE